MSSSGEHNARHISAREIAQSFVVPSNFAGVALFQNSLLVGPRGSGKTTILKALTSVGLHYLNQRPGVSAELENLKIDYFPCYIDAQANWKGDIETIKATISDSVTRNHILNGLFVDYTLHQVIEALDESKKLAMTYNAEPTPAWIIRITPQNEELISRSLSQLWQLRRVQTSFLGLKLALIERSNIYKMPFTVASDASTKRALQQPTLDVLEMLRGVIDVVQEIRPNTRWSFNFDEMEIAPKHIVSMLYENLRSWDQRAVLKFSLFPFVDFYSIEEKLSKAGKGPVDGQDYHTFSLSGEFAKHSSDSAKFVFELVEAECSKRTVTIFEFARYLNSSTAILKDTRKFNGLKTERNYHAIFNIPFVKKTDPQLVRFLADRGFNSSAELTSVQGENSRAQHIRKIAPLCEFRNYYLTHQRAAKANETGRNSPKGFGYFHGYEKILQIAEGNPRAIKYYVNDLLDAYFAKEQAVTAQNRAIRNNVDRFRALIASQVVPLVSHGELQENPLNFTDRLGSYFTREILGTKFKPEPSLSVIFRDLPDQQKRILEVAVNSGAVIVDRMQSESKLVFNVEDVRLRLSHRFAPFYPLPTITGKPIVLQSIPSGRQYRNEQSDLFGWEAHG